MFTRLLEWLSDLSGNKQHDSDDVTVEIARENYQKYLDEVEQKKKEYIKFLCDEIKVRSRAGRTKTFIGDIDSKLETIDFFMEIKDYFEARGFTVEYEFHDRDPMRRWLRISWLEDKKG